MNKLIKIALWVVSIAILLVITAILIGICVYSDVSWFLLWGWLIFLVLALLIFLASYFLYKAKKESQKGKRKIKIKSQKELGRFAEQIIENDPRYLDYLQIGEERMENLGQEGSELSPIYFASGRLYLSEKPCYVIINAETLFYAVVMTDNITWGEVEKIGMKLATNPATEDVTTTESTLDPSTGERKTKTTVKKLTKKQISDKERIEREEEVHGFGGESQPEVQQ